MTEVTNPNPDASNPPPAAPPAAAAKTVKVRVLTACAYGNANDVGEVPAAELKAAKADGLVDDNKAAVAYAEGLLAAAAASDVL